MLLGNSPLTPNPTPSLCPRLSPLQECSPSGTHRCSSSFLFSRVDCGREAALGQWGVQRFQTLTGVTVGNATLGPRYLQWTARSIGQQGEERGELLGVTRENQAGRRWALTSSVLPPCSCRAFCRSSTWARSSDSCCWFSLQEWGPLRDCDCPRPPLHERRVPLHLRRVDLPLTGAVSQARGARGWPPPGGAAAPPAVPGRPPPSGTSACSPAEAAGASPCRPGRREQG